MRTRKRPAGNRPSPKSRVADYHQSSGDYRHEAPTVEDRVVAEAFAVLTEHGYFIAVSCLVCGAALTNPRSVAAMVGPVCRKRLAEAVSPHE
ncbi:hypothetical protein NGTWS1702_23000 [Mycolicibacterium cyprinidarum]|uniref:DUF732 domain-containing protein n=1 Tax=Mycolicibacterium cyprinidarum TaxID=2860311 RepID=A0ABQ4VAU4_9MYCO|nr:hypothetical protein NGTWS1702_23000 [Mycolicibacterium sp. NGTWSNA01]